MNFTISEFIIDKSSTKVDICVADKILKHHIAIIQPIRTKLGCSIIVSKNSGYRRVEWELARRRSGLSQHCFLSNSLGAADYSCNENKIEELWEELKKSKYKRVCYYPENGFIHCDHKGLEKINFECNDGKNWVRL